MQENTSDEFPWPHIRHAHRVAQARHAAVARRFPALATALAESGLSVAGADFDLPFATRLAFWFAAVGVVLAGMISRKGLRRGRLRRAPALDAARLRRIESDGKLIAFEDLELEKGTQIELADRYLEDHGYGVIVTREPGDRVRRPPALDHPQPDHREGGRPGRGPCVRGVPGPPGRPGHPAGAGRGRDRALRPVRRAPRSPTRGSPRGRRAEHVDLERLGDAGPVPRSGHPAQHRPRGRPGAGPGPGRPHRGRGTVDFLREVWEGNPENRGGRPGPVRGGGRHGRAHHRPRPGDRCPGPVAGPEDVDRSGAT